MKKILFSLACGVMAAPCFAQLSMGAEGLFLSTGTAFIADSMIIINSVPRTFSNNLIQRIPGQINALDGPGNSITRVYDIANPITFSGIIGMKYGTGELAGNPESQLQLALEDTSHNWTTATGSSVDQTNNIITLSVPTARVFTRMTAVRSGVVLPLSVTSFTATLQAAFVALNWKVSDNKDCAGFDVQSSVDGRNWQTIIRIAPTSDPWDAAYTFQDRNIDFNVRYYRLASVSLDNKVNYTPTVSVRKDGTTTNKLSVEQQGNGISFRFNGILPEELSVYDMNGRTMMTTKNVAANYSIHSLPAGIYIARYLVNGNVSAQQFVVH